MPDVFTLESGTVLVGMIASICLHEAGHAHASDWLGDDTPRRAGKVTWNPIPHIQTSPIATLVIPVLSFVLSGGAGIIGGGACPVNPYNLRNPRRDEFLVAGAGPLMNLWLCGCATVGMIWVEGPSLTPILYKLALFNLFIATFNLIPIPPMDGSHMLAALFPGLRQPFRQVGLGAGILLAFVVGGMIMQQVFGPLHQGYREFLGVLGVALPFRF